MVLVPLMLWYLWWLSKPCCHKAYPTISPPPNKTIYDETGTSVMFKLTSSHNVTRIIQISVGASQHIWFLKRKNNIRTHISLPRITTTWVSSSWFFYWRIGQKPTFTTSGWGRGSCIFESLFVGLVWEGLEPRTSRLRFGEAGGRNGVVVEINWEEWVQDGVSTNCWWAVENLP